MAAWQTDHDLIHGLPAPPTNSLPTPQDTPYRTPSRASRRSRRSVTPPRKGTSTSPMAGDRIDKASKRSSKDYTIDGGMSILDPRRFTPTLHANLVSEILALRRDQEDKTKLIESLELALHTGKEEQDTLQENVTTSTKEVRSLKRQLSLLEGGTSSALGELARERDEAVDSVTDARKRLELAQKKIRHLEDDSQRVHDLWALDKDAWEDERRKYDRKIHVSEHRLKALLEEMAAVQAAQLEGVQGGQESEVEESGRENDGVSIRTMSMTNSIRFSLAHGSSLPNGHSLADELNFDVDTDDQTDLDATESVLSSPRHRRTFSRESVVSRLHRRNQSMESMKRPGSSARGRMLMSPSVLETLEGDDEDEEDHTLLPEPAPVPKVSYTDTGIQFSPPPSPKQVPVKPDTPEPIVQKLPELENSLRGNSDIEANQRRKRVSQPLFIEPRAMIQQMVSSAAQTMDGPLSPPKTPKSPYYSVTPPPELEVPLMTTSSTQTESPTPPRPSRISVVVHQPSYAPPPIPSISIQPPSSRPTSPTLSRLPSHFKHFGCQVNLTVGAEMADSSSQTEAIQIDKRLALLPPHLHPSAITSRPNSPDPSGVAAPDKNFTPTPGNVPPRNPRRLTNSRTSNEFYSSPVSYPPEDDEFHDAYPGNNDDGPLSSQRGSTSVRRPRRYSSLFAGFDSASSDGLDEFGGEVDLSDSEYRTALSAPRPMSTSTSSRAGKRGSTGPSHTSPEHMTGRRSGRSSAKPVATELHSSYNLHDIEFNNSSRRSGRSSRSYEKPPLPSSGPSSRASVMRKAAMIQNSMGNYHGRSRSPAYVDPRNPPYPIPTRASSRQPGASTPSDETRSRSPSMAEGWNRRNSGSRSYYGSNVRKVRSAAVLQRTHRYRRRGSGSPPPLSPSTEAPESPGLPPLPRNDITTPRNRDGSYSYRRHRHELSTNTDITNNTEAPSQSNQNQNPGVVESIAQTMVGEWMLKYVRRRKSFGMTDGTNKDETSNDRHKRWVWLAPYERAILWSSKQPSSGSALMGKTGRKLVIQSVLDVKDDNPAPKVMPSVFNRSILILTPQRALKFTAVTPERHYLWLTALSFLAHSSSAVPENLGAPQIEANQQQQQHLIPDFDIPRHKPKRAGIRDSIRIAKGKDGGQRVDQRSIPSIPSAPSSRMGDMTQYAIPELSATDLGHHTRELSVEAAEPPMIARFHERSGLPQPVVHGRKRSNTGGHIPPPLSFRGFSGPSGANYTSANSTGAPSVGTTGSSDIYQSNGSSNTTWHSQGGSERTSEASSRQGNFFDAIGTVRMEAFISPLAFSQPNEYPEEQEELRHLARRRSKDRRRRNSRNRHRENQHSRSTRGGYDEYYGGNKTAGEEDFFRDDPFKGF